MTQQFKDAGEPVSLATDVGEPEEWGWHRILLYESLVSAREGLISLAALRRVNQNVPLNPVAIGIFCQKPSRVFRGGHYRNVSEVTSRIQGGSDAA